MELTGTLSSSPGHRLLPSTGSNHYPPEKRNSRENMPIPWRALRGTQFRIFAERERMPLLET